VTADFSLDPKFPGEAEFRKRLSKAVDRKLAEGSRPKIAELAQDLDRELDGEALSERPAEGSTLKI
jgi:N-methylhydantoinase A/oxoprolinase/acetone carboxylase beta subunit